MAFNRYVAKKIRIKDTLEGTFNPSTEKEGSSVQVSTGQQFFRCNVMALVLHKEMIGSLTNLQIDDGSGQITIRSFEPNKQIDNLPVGTPILIIGKIRKYNEERYISPEIVKPILASWLKVRAKELEKENIIIENESIVEPVQKKQISPEKIQETVKEEKQEDNQDLLPAQKVIKLISELDKGEGVLMEDVIEKSSVEFTEKVLEQMLEKGDIFQIMPGKVKVL